MVGYAVSYDDSGNRKNISITVLDADDFAMEAYGCAVYIYRYNRDTQTFTSVGESPDSKSLDIKLLKNIVVRLQTEELKASSAVSVMWRSFPDSGVEIVKTDLSDEVWLPIPMMRDGADCDCIDITNVLFDENNPKPLEISIAVYLLNYLVWMSGIKISTVFFDCKARVFMNCNFFRFIVKIFGSTPVVSSDYANKYVRSGIFKHRTGLKTKDVINNLKTNCPNDATYEGGTKNIAVGIKNDCLKRCADSLIKCLCEQNTPESFVAEFKNHVGRAVSEFRVLSELFVAGENLYRTSDIMYLGLDDFLEACAFGESLLNLKKTVRTLTDNYRTISNQKIPYIILENDEYIY